MPGLAEQDIGNNVDSISITQIASELLSENLADLWIKKTSPAETLRAGEDINYTIEYGNSGSSGVQDTFVFDILPE